MKKRVVAMCLTTVFALGLGAPTAVAAPNPGAGEPFAPEEWVPVPKPAAVDRGPAPGTTCEAPGSVAEFVEITGSRYDVEGVVSTKNDIGDEPIPLTQTIKESKTCLLYTSDAADE